MGTLDFEPCAQPNRERPRRRDAVDAVIAADEEFGASVGEILAEKLN